MCRDGARHPLTGLTPAENSAAIAAAKKRVHAWLDANPAPKRSRRDVS